ncbi:hypothetical protein LH935_28050 (plasmid) [Gordonia polyisoprenivorans]|uniref:hypothetical protein n=1 Tax=Gordonia polyisoprenivorans TaxID=84595 RepID=UPI0022349178|nr:hypothetical protein [uncultured Gordonia sp.]UZF59341.1 hypothetical protein LH935_28050 [Gordonia polyisoprenivorans]
MPDYVPELVKGGAEGFAERGRRVEREMATPAPTVEGEAAVAGAGEEPQLQCAAVASV